MTLDLNELHRRLAAAERVCAIACGTAAYSETDRDKALTQAVIEWNRTYGHTTPQVTDAEIVELAARRDVIRNNTLVRMRRQQQEEVDRQQRLNVLEALDDPKPDTVE